MPFNVGDVVYCNYHTTHGYKIYNIPVTILKTLDNEYVFNPPTKEEGNPDFYPEQMWQMMENHYGMGTLTKEPVKFDFVVPKPKFRKIIN